MGRKPTRPEAIPRLRVRKQRSGRLFYYYDHGGSPRREEALGSDYGLAVKRWAEIEPRHVRQYLAWRSPKAKIRTNREKALLSHIWNWARGEGYTKLA